MKEAKDVEEIERARFLVLADRLPESDDAAERQKLKEELARMTFGGQAPTSRTS